MLLPSNRCVDLTLLLDFKADKPIPQPSLPPAEPEPPAQAPVVKTPPKTPPKVPTNPPEEQPDEPAEPPTQTPPGKNPKKPPTKPCKNKRAENPVDDAVHSRTTRLGSGNTGEVYKTTFEGRDAVVKVVDASRPGAGPENVRKEVSNLKTVGQLLGWGEKKNDNRNPGHFFYLIMPHMGVTDKDSGLSEGQLGELAKKAKDDYLKKYKMENRDKNPSNYVYRQVDGKWQAEIIDWARAEYTGKTPQPDAGTPEEVKDPAMCTHM
ncbi:hypothetical protein H0H87_010415 [Tephrocybe sp. NHM501043]|nr:hypothetical protein H0H87_010415 [Tephrocybe sp. NHM501043]